MQRMFCGINRINNPIIHFQHNLISTNCCYRVYFFYCFIFAWWCTLFLYFNYFFLRRNEIRKLAEMWNKYCIWLTLSTFTAAIYMRSWIKLSFDSQHTLIIFVSIFPFKAFTFPKTIKWNTSIQRSVFFWNEYEKRIRFAIVFDTDWHLYFWFVNVSFVFFFLVFFISRTFCCEILVVQWISDYQF